MKRLLTILLWAAGLVLLLVLVARQGAADVASAVAEVGWGLLAVSAFSLLVLVADTRGWQVLLPPDRRPSLPTMIWIRWVCAGINWLLPVVQVGGDLVRTRLIAKRGVGGATAGASVVVDITVSIATQIVFTVPGVIILVRLDGGGDGARVAVAGLAVFVVLLGGFYFAQRAGLFQRITRVMERVIRVDAWAALVGGARALDEAIAEVYRRRRDVLRASAWRLAGWIVGTGEVWLALHYLGHPVSVVEAFMLESMGQAVRNAAFMIPGALGVQDGAYILLGAAVGLDPQTGLALSLVKRVRELVLGVPALIVWQIVESRGALRASPPSPSRAR